MPLHLWALATLVVKSESESEVAQSCPTLCDPMDCSLSGSSIHGIFQARVLEWIAISFSRGYSPPRNRTLVSLIAGRCFTIWATREAQLLSLHKSLCEVTQRIYLLSSQPSWRMSVASGSIHNSSGIILGSHWAGPGLWSSAMTVQTLALEMGSWKVT